MHWGLTVYGTDGHAPWIEDCVGQGASYASPPFRDDDYQLHFGRWDRYEGGYHNDNHEWDFRREHHVPRFKRTVEESRSPWFIEWWVKGAEDTPILDEDHDSTVDPLAETIVHYRSDDRFLGNLLAILEHNKLVAAETDGRSSYFQIRPDLPDFGIMNDVVVETRLPRSPVDRYQAGMIFADATSVHSALRQQLIWHV